ncbi:MAG: hypothetical protein GXP58_09910 [Deltaproteobacteria bacterium]|nr:hypothetical protein [Deltaproteobacteria bacterium]
MKDALFDFILKEWLLLASGTGFLLTSIYTGHPPVPSPREMQVLFILFVLFIAVKGLQQSGIISRFARSIEKGRGVPLKLIVTTFFLSMVVTNDIALLVIVPLTLALNIDRRGLLVILEALAANAGSALTPFGNPQNLYIYWFYNLSPAEFITSIAPFSLMILFPVILSLTIHLQATPESTEAMHNTARSSVHGILLIIVLLSVLHILPIRASGIVVVYALLFDREALHVDYFLLFSFFFFFGLAENLKILMASEIKHAGHVFLFSALASQIMSNVPSTLLFAKFTSNWKALLWGTNVGGFGSIFGSLANMIAYKLYITDENTNDTASFTALFLIMGYIAFFAAAGLYITTKA